MLTAMCRALTRGAIALLLCALAVAAQAREGRASASMAVSVTIPEVSQAAAFVGERFVSGQGTPPACKAGEVCADVPLPKLSFSGAANSGTSARTSSPKR